METARLIVQSPIADLPSVQEAAEVIRRGGLVAFPTETVYGLGANAFDRDAVKQIYTTKRRAATDPCIVHIARVEDLARVADVVPDEALALATAFWPGPLSMVLPKGDRIASETTANGPTVAVRIPDHAVALALIDAAGVPIAAPSANTFGHVSPTTADHVLADLGGLIEIILDAGPTAVGIESTVLDLSGNGPRILRPGAVTAEMINRVLSRSIGRTSAAPQTAPHQRSPGLETKHYAPTCPLVVLRGEEHDVLSHIRTTAQELLDRGLTVGALVADEDVDSLRMPNLILAALGSKGDLKTVGRRLFASLRFLEDAGVDTILARSFSSHGIGRAIEDRLRRAAGGRILDV